MKRSRESFSELILRLAKEKERIWDYFGSVPLTEEEEKAIMGAIDRFRKQLSARVES